MKQLLSLAGLIVASLTASFASDRHEQIAHGIDIATNWKAGQHLYVKGNLGLPASQLDALEGWLDENGKNWIVILAQNAYSENFTEADGRKLSGMDAVEMAANVETRNRTAFGELTDPRSGEKNGAVFVLFLSERKFSYSGGEAHERRGLGAKNWAGNLDRPAFRAMSNGRRIADAVKDTVKEVDKRLSRQFEIEQQQRQRAIEAAKQLRTDAARVLAQANASLDELKGKLVEFRQADGDLDGDLAKPDVEALAQQLLNAKADLERENPGAALESASRVQEFCRAHARALLDYAEAPPKFAKLEAQLAELDTSLSDWARSQIETADKTLAQAKAAHARGDLAYFAQFQSAGEGYEAASNELSRVRAEIEADRLRRAQLEAERLKRIELLRNVAIGLAALIVLGLIGLAILLNRRRLPIKTEAVELYRNWKRGASEQTQGLFALLDRTTLVVGPTAKLEERGYAGDTLAISKAVIEDVDELFIMSSCVERVLEDVRELIFPANPVVRLLNVFSANRYRRAWSHLRTQPIRFRPEEGIEPIIREERDEPVRPLGGIEEHQSFELSFADLIAACNRHAARAKDGLDTVENAWATISDTLTQLQKDCTRLADREKALTSAKAEDGFFPMPALFEKLLPGIQRLLDEAGKTATGDPVGALRGPAVAARRRIDDGLGLAGVILDARRERFAKMREETAKLSQIGVGVTWVGRMLDEFSAEANAAAEKAVGEDIDQKVGDLKSALAKHDDRISKALKLAAHSREISAEQITSATKVVAAARRSTGSALKLKPAQTLREDGLDPDPWLSEAKRQREAAEVALDRGGVLAAEAALNEIQRLTEDVNGLVEATRHSLESHAGTAAARRAENARLAELTPERAKVLAELQTRYLGSALRRRRDDAGTTIEDNISDSQKLLAQSRGETDLADEDRAEARLLGAASRLELAADLELSAQQLLDEITDQSGRLERTNQENTHDFGRLTDRIAAMRPQIDDARTMKPTIAAFADSVAELEATRAAGAAEVLDPFAIADRLAAVTGLLDNLANRVEADWKQFDEASRSLEAARSQLAAAGAETRKAATDEIPDSAEITGLTAEVSRLEQALSIAAETRQRAHEDWAALDVEADRIAAAATRAAAELRGELEKAQAAVQALTFAAEFVRHAAGWQGAYGVSIPGTPGANALEKARQLLLSGQYFTAETWASDAGKLAQRAVASAEAEVARRRRAEERRLAEAARRAAAAAARRSRSFSASTFSSGSSFGSSGSSMGGSSFSGGSGMGRSGW